MNNRQASAFREMIRKEERVRDKWHATHQHLFGSSNRTAQNRSLSSTGPEVRRIRQIQVPYTQKLHVPVVKSRVVPVQTVKQVPTREVRQVPGFREVKQKYTVLENRPAVRKKEIWVKKVVPQRYMQQVEVPRTRVVRVPHTEVEQVPDFKTVEVIEHRPMSVDGYRIDEIDETNNRRIGAEVFHPDDERVRGLPVDSRANSPSVNGSFRAQSATASRQRTRGLRPSTTGSRFNKSQRGLNVMPTVPLKCRLKTATGSRIPGLSVQGVGHEGAAHRAGLSKGDVIQYVNNRPTRNMTELQKVLAQCSGPLHLTVARGGPTALQKLKLTVVRC